jgi:hypothetical protein
MIFSSYTRFGMVKIGERLEFLFVVSPTVHEWFGGEGDIPGLMSDIRTDVP